MRPQLEQRELDAKGAFFKHGTAKVGASSMAAIIACKICLPVPVSVEENQNTYIDGTHGEKLACMGKMQRTVGPWNDSHAHVG